MIEDANDGETHCHAESNSKNFLGFFALHVRLNQREVEEHEDGDSGDKRHKKSQGKEDSPCQLKPGSIFSDQSPSVLARTLTWSGFEEGGRQVEPLGRPEECERLLVEREAEHRSEVVGGATRREWRWRLRRWQRS